MELQQLIKDYSVNETLQKQGIFASIFLVQNRLQTACDKLDEEITMKQWLLLAMAGTSDEPMSLSDLGKLMGCSRQNVKKIALSLEMKGFLKLEKRKGDSRAVCVVLDEKMLQYSKRVGERQQKVLELLFRDFSEQDTQRLYQGFMKLQENIEKIEQYVEEEHE